MCSCSYTWKYPECCQSHLLEVNPCKKCQANWWGFGSNFIIIIIIMTLMFAVVGLWHVLCVLSMDVTVVVSIIICRVIVFLISIILRRVFPHVISISHSLISVNGKGFISGLKIVDIVIPPRMWTYVKWHLRFVFSGRLVILRTRNLVVSLLRCH